MRNKLVAGSIGRIFGEVALAIALREQDLAVLHNGDDGTGHVMLFHPDMHRAIEKGFQSRQIIQIADWGFWKGWWGPRCGHG